MLPGHKGANEMAFTDEQIKKVQEKRGLSRSGARQFLARQEKQAAKAEAKLKAKLQSDLARATAPKLSIVKQAAKAKAEKAPRKTKYKVNMDPERVKKLFRENKTVSATALALGYPKGTGNNRTYAALVKLSLIHKREGDK
jgi:hypothetical protein